MTDAVPAVLELDRVAVRRAGRTILGPIDWRVSDSERWVVIGPNASGKTTLLEVASTRLWPSDGAVTVLGASIGRVDARDLRRRIGFAGSALERDVPPELAAVDVVLTARHAALATWWHRWEPEDRDRAAGLLDRLGVGGLANRAFGVLSSGERRRVLIARALMPAPELLLLDEPASSLDLGAREHLVHDLASLAADASLRAIVLVTHHLEEIPSGFGHALVLAGGRAIAGGPIHHAFADDALSRAFGLPLHVGTDDGRWWARAAARAHVGRVPDRRNADPERW